MSIDADRVEMVRLFSEFLPLALASRYSELLRMRPAHWKKIDPCRVWHLTDCAYMTEGRCHLQDLLQAPEFSKHVDREVVVLHCGHDRPSMVRRSLRHALLGPTAVFEGFVSIIPGKLALVLNHDGELCIFSK